MFEGVQVTGIKFASDNDKQPISAEWKSDRGATGEVRFKWLVDASGRTGIMSTKYLKNRKFNQALKNIAFWGYWTGAGTYEPGTKRENAPWFEALTGRLIILNDARIRAYCFIAWQMRPGGRGSSRCTTAQSRSASSSRKKRVAARRQHCPDPTCVTPTISRS